MNLQVGLRLEKCTGQGIQGFNIHAMYQCFTYIKFLSTKNCLLLGYSYDVLPYITSEHGGAETWRSKLRVRGMWQTQKKQRKM